MIHVIVMGLSCLISLFSVILLHLTTGILLHPVICILMILGCYISGIKGWERGIGGREHRKGKKNKKEDM